MNVEDDTVYKVPCNDIHCTLHTKTFLSAGVQNDFDDAAIKKIHLKYTDCVNLGEKGWLCILMSSLYVRERLDFYDWIHYFIPVWLPTYFCKVDFGRIMVSNSLSKKILSFIYNLFCKKPYVIRFYTGWNCFKTKTISILKILFKTFTFWPIGYIYPQNGQHFLAIETVWFLNVLSDLHF